jgi:hypothetical protein
MLEAILVIAQFGITSPNANYLHLRHLRRGLQIWTRLPLCRSELPTLLLVASIVSITFADDGAPQPPLRIGIIGLDTSHAIQFTKLLNADSPQPEFANCRVVAAYPHGSLDIESSTSRIDEYTAQVREMGVEIADSIDDLIHKVDAVLLETNDGRRHLEQAIPVLKTGKRTFIDKPMAASLADAIAIFDAAQHYNAPVFTSSALRFGSETRAVRKGAIGDVLACDICSPCSLESTHPDFSWYGIHGVEALFTVMGADCQTVARTHNDGQDFAVGTWKNGRIGTYRGMRVGLQSYGGVAFGTTDNRAVGSFDGYEPLLVEIVRFFRGGEPPVTAQETIEIFAFIEAADRSKRLGGTPVDIADVIKSEHKAAAQKRTW